MPRISPKNLSEIPELQAIFDAGEKMMGFVPNDGLIMAHKPAILKAFLGLVQGVYADGEVENGLKRLVGLVASTAAGCQYCQAHAANSAKQHGVDLEKIQAVWEFRESDLFTPMEKAALEVAWRASIIPNTVRDSDFDRLKQYFSEGAIVEIMAVVSMYGFLNRWNATFQTPLEEKPQDFFQQVKGKH